MGTSDPQRGPYGKLRQAVRDVVHSVLARLWGEPPAGPAERERLTFVEMFEYAAGVRAGDPRIRATLVRREPRGPDALFMTQVFLDERGELVRSRHGLVGRQLLVERLDDQLTGLFSDDESIVVELP